MLDLITQPLTDAKPMHKTKKPRIIRKVKSKQGGNYLFVFLKKIISNERNNIAMSDSLITLYFY
jgi:hypothetical protein